MNIQTETTNVPYVIPLYDLTRADVSRVGAKAANLGELAHFGFPVPDGFALTTHAFDHFIKVNALEEAQSPETVAKAELPPEMARRWLCVPRAWRKIWTAHRSRDNTKPFSMCAVTMHLRMLCVNAGLQHSVRVLQRISRIKGR